MDRRNSRPSSTSGGALDLGTAAAGGLRPAGHGRRAGRHRRLPLRVGGRPHRRGWIRRLDPGLRRTARRPAGDGRRHHRGELGGSDAVDADGGRDRHAGRAGARERAPEGGCRHLESLGGDGRATRRQAPLLPRPRPDALASGPHGARGRPDRPLLVHAPGVGRGPTADRRHPRPAVLRPRLPVELPVRELRGRAGLAVRRHPRLLRDRPALRGAVGPRQPRPALPAARAGLPRSRAAVRLEPPGRPPDEGRDLLERGRRCRVRSGGVPRADRAGRTGSLRRGPRSRRDRRPRRHRPAPRGLGLARGGPRRRRDDRRHGPRPRARVVGRDLRGGFAERLDRGAVRRDRVARGGPVRRLRRPDREARAVFGTDPHPVGGRA